jgi:hypothetical protein
MISLDLAQRLQDAGVEWTPGDGDRFWVTERDLDDVVFVVSHMVVEAQDLASETLLAFNGTTEWALDSVLQREVVWLPREDQLRQMLEGRFRSLTAVPGGYVVVVDGDAGEERHVDVDAECAYARAVLAGLGSAGPSA